MFSNLVAFVRVAGKICPLKNPQNSYQEQTEAGILKALLYHLKVYGVLA
jgi:hypothetical protein